MSIVRCTVILGLMLNLTTTAATAFAQVVTRGRADKQVGDISFTTLNVRWYGLGGVPTGGDNSEKRDATIRKHLDDNALWADVMAFQEIVDVSRFVTKVIGDSYNCESYDSDSADPRHQHVVLCVRQGLRLETAEDDNYTIEDLTLGRLRPGVHGNVVDSRGEVLAHVVAVHLKAMPQERETRMTQMRILGESLHGMKQRHPTVILGDMNTFEDEDDEFNEILQGFGLNIQEIESTAEYTFRTRQYTGKFDRVFVSGLSAINGPSVAGPCNSTDPVALDRYYNEVSDHCALHVKLRATKF